MTPQDPTPLALRRTRAQIGQHLAAWRKLAGLTQAQLADRADVNRETIRTLERGESGVTTDTLLRVLRALGLLDVITAALDPYESDVGRLRADEKLPRRVRPRDLS